MIDAKVLAADLTRMVRVLEADLCQATEERGRIGDVLRSEYERAPEGGPGGVPWPTWRDRRLTRSAVGWVLDTVFVRFCEDNRLLGASPALAGALSTPGEAGTQHGRGGHSAETARERLLACLEGIASTTMGARLFDGVHHPRHLLPLSADAAQALVAFWGRRDGEGRLVHDFGDPNLDTRFLVDLYTGLSESERAEHALLPTPEYVVDLILDLTLEPAAEEFGYKVIRVIDPVCGSGQFVLGAFRRLLHEWTAHRPDLHLERRVRHALEAVHGVDLTPSSVAITRFRLLSAAIQAVGATTLDTTSDLEWPLNITVGDSLRSRPESAPTGGFHVVVGNPPYTTVKDRVLSRFYRERYDACMGAYPLTVPFAQRFFELARPVDGDGGGAGYVGQLTSNSFMKREFGRKLAVDFFASRVSLTHVLDTSGAFIPGHGTPTAVLVGRNCRPVDDDPVLVVAGERGEPSRPDNPRHGMVWQSILRNTSRVGWADRWTRSFYLGRERLREFPWRLVGGGAAEVLDAMSSTRSLGDLVERIGYMAITGSDAAFVAPEDVFRRHGLDMETALVGVVTGSDVRDWAVHARQVGLFPPRREQGQAARDISEYPRHHRRLWPYRTVIRNRPDISVGPTSDSGRRWYDWLQAAGGKRVGDWLIIFPWVAGHSHFALVRRGIVSLQSAPVVELPETATKWQHIFLAGLLNSSAVCFWLKQHSNSKGRSGHQDGGEAWQDFYEFTSSRLRDLPLPADFHTWQAGILDGLARERATCTPEAVTTTGPPTAARLADARRRWESIGREMIAVQEELDWEIYSHYGLLPGGGLVASPDSIPPLNLGERAFEIVLARRLAAGEEDTTWFARHGSAAVTDVPGHWPACYREVVARRIEMIDRHGSVAVLERPEYKRRWVAEAWESMQAAALRRWLLDRCESAGLWFEELGGVRRPRPLTVRRLAELVCRDYDAATAAELYAPGKKPVDVVTDLVADEHVPHLAAMRYTPSGLAKRSVWEEVWKCQRAEDAASTDQERLAVRERTPLPRRYISSDFIRPSFWRQRGKMDVPNERFISYLQVDSDAPGGLLLGWAGWDDREQAQVLADLVTEAVGGDADEPDRVVPLLAGLYEILPWVAQWHDQPDRACELTSGLTFEEFIDKTLKRVEGGVDVLREWRPQPPRRGRPRKPNRW